MRAKVAQRDFYGDEVLSVKGLGKAYDGRTLFSDVELQVAGGERIALLGDNGTGKSTFLKLLLGEEAGAGRVKFGPTVKWAYLPQIIHFAHPERTLLDTMLYEKNCTPQTARSSASSCASAFVSGRAASFLRSRTVSECRFILHLVVFAARTIFVHHSTPFCESPPLPHKKRHKFRCRSARKTRIDRGKRSVI